MSRAKLSVENATVVSNGNDEEFFRSLALDSVSPSCYEDPFFPEEMMESPGFDHLKKEFDIYLPNEIPPLSDEDISGIIGEGTELHFNSPDAPMSSAVPLSTSVGVIKPSRRSNPARPIAIAAELEPTYKPRYKSDYFSQDGTVRRPRHVTDCHGNHFVPLKIAAGLRGFIRVDWVTVENEQKMRHSMPYQFQIDNENSLALDVNPWVLEVLPDADGFMPVYLVLIKSKQERLTQVQPLAAFPPMENAAKAAEPLRLPPKDLIKTYQLNKSQLAFTYCSPNPDGRTCTIHWDTTVYSTVLTEEASKKRKICCPHCTHEFEIADCENDDGTHERSVKKKR